MKPMTCEEVRRCVGGQWIDRGDARAGSQAEPLALEGEGRARAPATAAAQTLVHRVGTDSRHAQAGELFFALKGERFDGHDHLPAAAAAGCAAAVVRCDYRPGAPLAGGFPGGLIGVADPAAALGALGSHYRDQFAATVVGVTGSNGKTTTKRMIHHVLSKRLGGSCSPKSFNNHLGVPLSLLAVEERDQYVVCELGSNAPGEIVGLAAWCRPNVAVITSVGPTHLEKLLSIEGVAAEKASILAHLAAGGLAIVNGDSEPLAEAIGRFGPRIVRFGCSEGCDLRLTEYVPTAAGQKFQVNGRLWVELPAPGKHNAMNALAALAVARELGIALEEAAGFLADFGGTDMRLQSQRMGPITVINDAYNANPASVAAGAAVLADLPAARRVMVVGDMRELGPDTDSLHVATGRDIAARGIDLVIGVGELGGLVARGAAAGGAQTRTFASVQEACQGVPALLGGGDAVLIKGSRAMAMERLLEPLAARFGPRNGSPAEAVNKGPTA